MRQTSLRTRIFCLPQNPLKTYSGFIRKKSQEDLALTISIRMRFLSLGAFTVEVYSWTKLLSSTMLEFKIEMETGWVVNVSSQLYMRY